MIGKLILSFAFGATMATITASAGMAQANTLFLLQESPVGSPLGNTVVIDQTAGFNTLIAGAAPETPLGGNTLLPPSADVSDFPALQRGEGNFADITITGTGGMAILLQQGLDGGFGNSNSALIEVSGTDALGVLEQSGNNNIGTVRVSGIKASGQLVQRGDGNQMTLDVVGDGSSVAYEQVGNNLTPQVAAQVFSTAGGTIQITQTR